MNLSNLQKKIMYEIKKVKSEYPDKRNISLRLTTMIKRFNYNNSIVNDIMKKRISKAAKNLENKKLVLITFKSNDLYNPGEEYTGEAYNLNLEKIDLIDKLILKPNYLLNRLIGISFNIGITFIILLLIYTICLAISLFSNIIDFLSNEKIYMLLGSISSLLLIIGTPFTIISYLTKAKNKNKSDDI